MIDWTVWGRLSWIKLDQDQDFEERSLGAWYIKVFWFSVLKLNAKLLRRSKSTDTGVGKRGWPRSDSNRLNQIGLENAEMFFNRWWCVGKQNKDQNIPGLLSLWLSLQNGFANFFWFSIIHPMLDRKNLDPYPHKEAYPWTNFLSFFSIFINNFWLS